MKSGLLFLLGTCIITHAFSQTICQTGGEGSTLTLTAPAGKVFISVTFASYGTPNGTCGSFTIGACHAANSKTIVEAALLGQNSASIAASNGVFGDPCGGTVKRLYIEAVYGDALPLHLLSFTGNAAANYNALQWQTADEVNINRFVIERSDDGIRFSKAGSVAANNQQNNRYSFNDMDIEKETMYYRLKMMENDGSFNYSPVVPIQRVKTGGITVRQNQAAATVTVNGLAPGSNIELVSIQGQRLKTIAVTTSAVSFDLSPYPAGIYFIKCYGKDALTVRKIVKE
jgi:hypothetical protein